MNTITKKILIDRIAESTGAKRVAVKQVVQEFLDQVIVELGEGNRLEFRDFGVFEVKQRAPRIAQNPKTLERVPVPAKRTVKFKVGRRMREAMESADEKSAPGATPAMAAAASASPSAASSASSNEGERGRDSQSEAKLRVEMGPAVAGTIRSASGEKSKAREQEAASVR